MSQPLPSAPGSGWSGAVALAALTFATHAANFGFTIAGSRLLAPGDFGTLTALLGIVLIGMAPGMAIQALTAAGTLGRAVTIDGPLARRLALAIAGVVAVLMIVLGKSLGTTNPVAVLAIGTAAGLLPLTAANEGLLQGGARFAALGTVLLAGASVKFLTGVGAMLSTRAVWGAALAIALGYCTQLAMSQWLSGGLGGDARVPRRRLSRAVVSAVAMMGMLLVLIHLDAVLARILLDDVDAGLYAVGASAMRIVFWAPQFVVLLLFPRLVRDPRRRLVGSAILGLTGVGVVGAGIAAVAGPVLVSLVFGSQYEPIGVDLWRFAWLGTAAVGMQVLALSDLASGRREALWLLVAAVGSIVAVLLGIRPTNPTAIVTTVATIVSGFVVVGFLRRLSHATPTPVPAETTAMSR